MENILDFVKREEPKARSKTKVPMICEECSAEFWGEEWLLREKAGVTCPRCWRYKKLDDQEQN